MQSLLKDQHHLSGKRLTIWTVTSRCAEFECSEEERRVDSHYSRERGWLTKRMIPSCQCTRTRDTIVDRMRIWLRQSAWRRPLSPERKSNIKTNNHLILLKERLKSLRIWYLPSEIDQSNVDEAVSDRMAFAPMLTYHESITGTDCSRHYFLLAWGISGASIEKYIEMCSCVCIEIFVDYQMSISLYVCPSQRISWALREIDRSIVSRSTEGGLTNVVAYCFQAMVAETSQRKEENQEKQEKKKKQRERSAEKNDNNTTIGT